MQQIFEGLPKEPSGATIIGNDTRGCRHCGTVEKHYSQNRRVVWYHPGTTCCLPALKDQLRWRQAEVQALRQEIIDYQKRIDAMHVALEQATGQEKAVLANEINKQSRALEKRVIANTLKAKGDASTGTQGIQHEIDALQQAIANCT